ncbi:MAG TPA: M1 family aminopeptidase, partial [Thermodesulfobacteriota bacterium]|nr:M1 family aminopeptidase [Thermodesulfobacteriota bacterium]
MVKRFLLIFLLLTPCMAHALEHSAEDIPDYTLQVSFDVRASTIRGVATMPVVKGQELILHIGRLNLLRVSMDDREIPTSAGEDTIRILPSSDGVLAVRYEGLFKESPYGEQASDVISDKGLFLMGTWYPKPDHRCQYHLTALLPEGYEAMSEAETIEKSTRDGKTVFAFDFPHPLDAVSLIASNLYRMAKDHVGNVEIFAYFFPEDTDLAKIYIEHAKHYLKLYDTLINKYPYKRFSIVENFLPTGYSMPTYTLLGQAVVRLPFIPETSLGHEILHQWFGNSVYIDYQRGNWAEGLTTFLADHLYQEEKGLGPDYRKGVLIDYQSYVNNGNEFPLTAFTSRTDHASEAIGYGKALMVFQMLKDLVGRERFYESIRYFIMDMRFKKASWEDIKRAFEKQYQKDLTPFFSQWIDEKGLPDFHLEEVEIRPSGSNFEVAFTVLQKGKVYTLDLPVAVYSYAGKTKHCVHLSKEKERFEIIAEGLPERIVLDEEYAVGRRLLIDEFPPVIARLLGDEKRIIVLPPSGPEIYEEVVSAFKKQGDRVNEPKSITFEDLKTHSLVILGADNPMVGRLYGSLAMQGGFNVVMKENPWNRRKVAGIFDARSKEEMNAAFHK